jgi:type VI secretion system protein ImpF
MKVSKNIRASILDRLVDLETKGPNQSAQNHLFDIRRLKDIVVRDIENLLNTRRQILFVPASYKHVNNSVFVYGLEDFTAENPRSPSVRQRLRRDIEKTISKFEPRLKNATVHMERNIEKGQNLRFRISGMLVIESEAEPVSFDTYFDKTKGEYVIEK